ncbi:hypothetical protein [uncultured Zhongshania sp.]|uniref:hypothetical protein n=1 Tax=uncultured Zhongshania sp. TaxID=1642288 RepID=UPI0025FBDFF5|nr:hypothetical protein [uncultured Zhongshania sp.]
MPNNTRHTDALVAASLRQDDPTYASALPYLLRSNDFIRISLEANGIYAPPILLGKDEENLLGFKKELWLVGIKLSKQTFPEKAENVSFF